MPPERMESSPTDPTVLWRMTRGRNAAHATIFPGDRHNTVTWFFDGVMDRAEQYDSIELAMARAEEIRGILLRDGWKETSPARPKERAQRDIIS